MDKIIIFGSAIALMFGSAVGFGRSFDAAKFPLWASLTFILSTAILLAESGLIPR